VILQGGFNMRCADLSSSKKMAPRSLHFTLCPGTGVATSGHHLTLLAFEFPYPEHEIYLAELLIWLRLIMGRDIFIGARHELFLLDLLLPYQTLL
jgi:hypothetical protein